MENSGLWEESVGVTWTLSSLWVNFQLIKCTSPEVPGTQRRTSCLLLTGLCTSGNCGIKPVADFEEHTGDGLFRSSQMNQLSATEAVQPLVYTDTVITDLLAVRVVVELMRVGEWRQALTQAFSLMLSSSCDSLLF